jgi:membrane-associated phospholipid phosphatase
VKDFIKNNYVPLTVYLALLLFSLNLILVHQKNELHLSINKFVGNPVIDKFFFFVTYLGDGRMAAFIILAILLYNLRLGIYATTSLLSASLFSVILKEIFFDDVNRPHFIFTYFDKQQLNLVEGVNLHIHNSFPSGHTTQAFAIFMCLVFFTSKNRYKLLFLALAVFTSFSRVYLSQHWMDDITAGSVIGVAFAILYYFVFITKNKLQQFDKSYLEYKRLGVKH